MKGLYIAPELEIIKFVPDDVIVTSVKVDGDVSGDDDHDFDSSFNQVTLKGSNRLSQEILIVQEDKL